MTQSHPRPLGAHMSIAGGHTKAIDRAESVNADALQIFTKNQVQWRVPELTDAQVGTFRTRLARSPIRYLCTHASYLINVASPDDVVREKSIAMLQTELERADRLMCSCVVMHPGSGKDSPAEMAFERLVEGLATVLKRTRDLPIVLALENTAGQGACLGRSFAEIGAIIDACDSDPRLGLCVDTCHAFAAGYDLNDQGVPADMVSEIEEYIGIQRLCLLHLNNSKHPCASRKDRHAHIADGLIAPQSFGKLLRQPEISTVPGIIETPKDATTLAEDKVNLALLRNLDAQFPDSCQ